MMKGAMSHLTRWTRWTKAMGFDPKQVENDGRRKSRGVSRPSRRDPQPSGVYRFATGSHHRPETDSDVLRKARACWLFFPEGWQLVDRIESVYDDAPEVKKTVLLSAILAAIEKLV